MSFTFGQFDSETFGVIATLKQLPSFAGHRLETVEVPGTDAKFFGGSSKTGSIFVFDTILTGNTVTEAHSIRDRMAALLDPARGIQKLAFDAMPGWEWSAIISKQVDWERLSWDAGAGFRFRADVTFEALETYGRRISSENWSYTSEGSRAVTPMVGNTVSFPTVEVRGRLLASESVTVNIGGVSVEVGGPLNTSEVLRLDWDKFDFSRWSGNNKIDSVVRRMSTLDRPELWPNTAITFGVSSDSGTFTSWSESRRNRMLNPSFENGLTTWSRSGNNSWGTSTEWSNSGVTSARSTTIIENATGADVRIGSASEFPAGMVAGRTWTISGTVRLEGPYTHIHERNPRIALLYSTDNNSFTFVYGDKAPNRAGAHRVSVTAAVPSNATGVIVMLASIVNLNQNVFWDSIMSELADSANTYFDGDSTSNDDLVRYRWAGNAHNAYSVMDTRQREAITGVTLLSNARRQ